MSRLNRDQLIAAATENLGATPDPSGNADLVFDRGSIVVAADANDFKGAFKRLKKNVDGYRWALINKEDLFAANTLSIGSKAGMITSDGTVLKNADIPRKKA
ncbi:MAG: hypothetical protein HKN03_03680 [Acidimicrobiales bacterium]|nr:hypothetical protein [Acidimicrobiales bacterium]